MGLWLPADILVSADTGGADTRIHVYDPADGSERGVVSIDNLTPGAGFASFMQLRYRAPYVYGSWFANLARSAGVDDDLEIVATADGTPADAGLTGIAISPAGHFFFWQEVFMAGFVAEIVELDGSFAVAARHDYSESDPDLPSDGARANTLCVSRDGALMYFADFGLLPTDTSQDEPLIARFQPATDTFLAPLNLSAAFVAAGHDDSDNQYSSMALDGDDNIYLLVVFNGPGESGNWFVFVIDSGGAFVKEHDTGEFDEAVAVALSPDEAFVYVLGHDYLKKINNASSAVVWSIDTGDSLPSGAWGMTVATASTDSSPLAGVRGFVAMV